MWFLIKSFVGFGCLCLAAYGVFFVELADKSLALHAQDVWKSPVVQQKISLLEDGMKNKLQERLEEATNKSNQHESKQTKSPTEAFEKIDREQLQKVIAGALTN